MLCCSFDTAVLITVNSVDVVVVEVATAGGVVTVKQVGPNLFGFLGRVFRFYLYATSFHLVEVFGGAVKLKFAFFSFVVVVVVCFVLLLLFWVLLPFLLINNYNF